VIRIKFKLHFLQLDIGPDESIFALFKPEDNFEILTTANIIDFIFLLKVHFDFGIHTKHKWLSLHELGNTNE